MQHAKETYMAQKFFFPEYTGKGGKIAKKHCVFSCADILAEVTSQPFTNYQGYFYLQILQIVGRQKQQCRMMDWRND